MLKQLDWRVSDANGNVQTQSNWSDLSGCKDGYMKNKKRVSLSENEQNLSILHQISRCILCARTLTAALFAPKYILS